MHHTASTNAYEPDDVVNQIRGFYDLHTGPTKEWPDVAYNFFIDRFGTIWEGREGSIAGPVRGDATGGSQGHALLASLIGNHAEEPVTAAQQDSLSQLLAWLAERHNIDTAPGATVDFVSRGSNKWPEGAAVSARTISGHREMSATTCPGDFAFDLLESELPTRVSALRADALATVGPTTTATTTNESTTTTTTAEGTPPTTAGSSPTATPGTSPDATLTPSGAEDAAGPIGADAKGEAGTDSGVSSRGLLVTGGVLGVVAALGAAVTRLLPGGPRQRTQD